MYYSVSFTHKKTSTKKLSHQSFRCGSVEVNLISIHEDVGSISALAQWVRASSVSVSCGIGHRCGLDPAPLWLWCRPAAVAWIWPLGWDPPYAVGVALKRPKKKKLGHRVPVWLSGLRIWCYCSGSGHCCGVTSIPGWELPHAMGVAKKKKKKAQKGHMLSHEKILKLKIMSFIYMLIYGIHWFQGHSMKYFFSKNGNWPCVLRKIVG